MDTIRVGLIGSGFMGKCHAMAWNGVATAYGDVPRPVLSHVCEVSEDLARERAAAFGFARSGTDWRALVNDPDIDVVSITAPNAVHAPMAIAALEAGKHVWCEKPMAPTLAEAQAMRDAAKASGRVAVLGYNYIQSPALRLIERLLREGAIGVPNQVRFEMDEDFMADAAAPFSWRSEAQSGLGALDDFGVHPLSMVSVLFGDIADVFCTMDKPYATRPVAGGGTREVETFDQAAVLMKLANGMSGSILLSRAAWGRKGRIQLQIFGSDGAIVFDQERFNEVQLFSARDPAHARGFRTILMGPEHAPYGVFTPAPGHQIGFNELKVMECRALIGRLRGEAASAPLIDFDQGLAIERAVHAMAQSSQTGRWTSVAGQQG